MGSPPPTPEIARAYHGAAQNAASANKQVPRCRTLDRPSERPADRLLRQEPICADAGIYRTPLALGTGPRSLGAEPDRDHLPAPAGGAMRGPPATPAPRRGRRGGLWARGARRCVAGTAEGRGQTGACAWSSVTTRTAGLRRQPDAPASARRPCSPRSFLRWSENRGGSTRTARWVRLRSSSRERLLRGLRIFQVSVCLCSARRIHFLSGS